MTRSTEVNDGDIVQLTGHIYQGNDFRSRPLHIKGSPTLIGRIHDRHEIFDDKEAPAE